jgi:hypothetical protein
MDRVLPESGFINEKIRGHMPKRKDHRKRNKNPLQPSLWARFAAQATTSHREFGDHSA